MTLLFRILVEVIIVTSVVDICPNLDPHGLFELSIDSNIVSTCLISYLSKWFFSSVMYMWAWVIFGNLIYLIRTNIIRCIDLIVN